MLAIFIRFEPGDSRAVSDEFVALAAIAAGRDDKACWDVIDKARRALANPASLQQEGGDATAKAIIRTSDTGAGDDGGSAPAPQRWLRCSPANNWVVVCPECDCATSCEVKAKGTDIRCGNCKTEFGPAHFDLKVLDAPDAQLDEIEAAARIVDIMSGGDRSWRDHVSFPDCLGSTFLESADWLTALEYARAARGGSHG